MSSRSIVCRASRFVSSLGLPTDCYVSCAGHKVRRSLARVVCKSPNYDADTSLPAGFSSRCTFKEGVSAKEKHFRGMKVHPTSRFSGPSRSPCMIFPAEICLPWIPTGPSPNAPTPRGTQPLESFDEGESEGIWDLDAHWMGQWGSATNRKQTR
jgi:hypothetical protein